MAKFFGEIGFAESQETAPGVWKDVITEYPYYGDVLRNTRNLESGDKLNDDIDVTNRFSIVGDAYLHDHFFAIRYIHWMGSLWKVTEVSVEAPRLVLRVGGVYNGPTP